MQRNTISCLIIEDEPDARAILQKHIEGLPFLALRGTFRSVEAALPILREPSIDLLFLDIHLPGMSGMTGARRIPPSTKLIFTTAYAEYAAEGFELEVVDYLLKPVSLERFTKAVNRYLQLFRREEYLTDIPGVLPERPFLFIRRDRVMVKLFIDEILYLEAQRNYVLVRTEKESFKTYQSITEMQEKLPAAFFMRVHRSFMVSVQKVTSYAGSYLLLGKHKVPVGRQFAPLVKKLLPGAADETLI